MHYRSIDDLPNSVRDTLPLPAQEIYRDAFNKAFEQRPENPIEEADAHNLAWAAVERRYAHEGGEWVPRGVLG